MVKKLIYPATFVQDGDYIFVEFPDVSGAFTQGETLQEAYEMAEEVLGSVLADQNHYPVASSIHEISESNPGKDVALVSVDLEGFRRKYRSKSVRRNVTIPQWLNDIANSEKINVSQVASDALKEKLGV